MSCAGTPDYNYYNGFLGGDTQSAPARQSGIAADEPADAPAAGMTSAENDITTSPSSTFDSILFFFIYRLNFPTSSWINTLPGRLLK